MKFWLDIPCKDLSREWLLDEHRSVHAYFNAMHKNFTKWIKHPLFGPMDAFVLERRHQEQVEEMKARGYNHSSEIDDLKVSSIAADRIEWCLDIGEFYVNDIVVCVEELEQLQLRYVEKMFEPADENDVEFQIFLEGYYEFKDLGDELI